MKNLKLNTILLVTDNDNKTIPFQANELLLTVLRAPTNPAGSDFESMSTAVLLIKKVKDALEENSENILLDSSEHDSLAAALRAFKFRIIDPAIYDWVKEIINLPDVKIEIAKERIEKEA